MGGGGREVGVKEEMGEIGRQIYQRQEVGGKG